MKKCKESKFTKEEIAAFVELGAILRRIHRRLVREGVDIEGLKRKHNQYLHDKQKETKVAKNHSSQNQ